MLIWDELSVDDFLFFFLGYSLGGWKRGSKKEERQEEKNKTSAPQIITTLEDALNHIA